MVDLVTLDGRRVVVVSHADSESLLVKVFFGKLQACRVTMLVLVLLCWALSSLSSELFPFPGNSQLGSCVLLGMWPTSSPLAGKGVGLVHMWNLVTLRERERRPVVGSRRVRLTEETPRPVAHGISRVSDSRSKATGSMVLWWVGIPCHCGGLPGGLMVGQVQETGLSFWLGEGGGALPLPHVAWCASFQLEARSLLAAGVLQCCFLCILPSIVVLHTFFRGSSKIATKTTTTTATTTRPFVAHFGGVIFAG